MKKCLRIAVFNSKGGPGKSTLCWGIAVALFLRGYRVLIIDGDFGQLSTGDMFTARKERLGNLAALNPPSEGVLHVHPTESPSRADTHGEWEYVFYDLPGREDREARAVLVQVDLVLVPMRPSHLDTRAMGRPLDVIRGAAEARGSALPAYLIVNAVRRGTRAAAEIEKLRPSLPAGLSMMVTHVRALEDWVTACGMGLCPIELPRNGKIRANSEDATEDLVSLTNEFLEVCSGRHD